MASKRLDKGVGPVRHGTAESDSDTAERPWLVRLGVETDAAVVLGSILDEMTRSLIPSMLQSSRGQRLSAREERS